MIDSKKTNERRTQYAERATGRFRIGDLVRNGTRVATVTDVGTVLIAVRTAVGAARMVCPWELVRMGTFDHEGPSR